VSCFALANDRGQLRNKDAFEGFPQILGGGLNQAGCSGRGSGHRVLAPVCAAVPMAYLGVMVWVR
jgi:hypothetical protein